MTSLPLNPALLRRRYGIVSQVYITVIGAHIIWTEHWLCNGQTRLLCKLSCCRCRRQHCDIRRVGRRTDVFIRSTFSAGTPRVGEPHVHVWSVGICSQATSTGCNVCLRYGAVNRQCCAVGPLHTTTSWTTGTANTCKTLNTSSFVDVF